MAMRQKLPRRQKEVLEHIVKFMNERGYPPSTRDLCDMLGVTSSSTIHTHLQGLIARGLINKPHYKSRSITLPPKLSQVALKKELVNVPLVGKVQAGTEPTAMDNLDDQFPLPAQLVGSKEALMVRVGDASMASEGLQKGDMAIVRPQATVKTGELVAAVVEGTPVVRRYRKDKKDAYLDTANGQSVDAKGATLLGKVVGIIRKLA